MTEEQKKYASELINITQSILEQAEEIRENFIYDNIDWDELYCLDVRYIESYYDGESIDVIVHGAEPYSLALVEYIENRLIEKGYMNIKVLTQW